MLRAFAKGLFSFERVPTSEVAMSFSSRILLHLKKRMIYGLQRSPAIALPTLNQIWISRNFPRGDVFEKDINAKCCLCVSALSLTTVNWHERSLLSGPECLHAIINVFEFVLKRKEVLSCCYQRCSFSRLVTKRSLSSWTFEARCRFRPSIVY